jgi:hypothetical protein
MSHWWLGIVGRGGQRGAPEIGVASWHEDNRGGVGQDTTEEGASYGGGWPEPAKDLLIWHGGDPAAASMPRRDGDGGGELTGKKTRVRVYVKLANRNLGSHPWPNK